MQTCLDVQFLMPSKTNNGKRRSYPWILQNQAAVTTAISETRHPSQELIMARRLRPNRAMP